MVRMGQALSQRNQEFESCREAFHAALQLLDRDQAQLLREALGLGSQARPHSARGFARVSRCDAGQCASDGGRWASSGAEPSVAQPAILTSCTMRSARQRRKCSCVRKLCCGMRLLGHAHLAVLVDARHACAAPFFTEAEGPLPLLMRSAHLLACNLF